MLSWQFLMTILFLAAFTSANRRRPTDFSTCRWKNGGCAQRCEAVGNRHRCLCLPGFNLTQNRKDCIDMNECSGGNDGCQHNCLNMIGSYRCSCRPGFILEPNGRDCTRRGPANSCARNSLNCHHFCNITSGQASCGCRKGYRLMEDGRSCRRLCSNGNGGCQHICHATPQGNYCSCQRDYVLHENRRSCMRNQSCAVDNGGCNAVCEETPIGVQCSCPEGFILQSDRRSCQDVDECATGNGECEYNCRNIPGSYKCTCPDGYKLSSDQRTCVDTDECLLNDTCWYKCTNTPGSFVCSCRPGFQVYARIRCGDINECSVNNGGCSHFCSNRLGGYDCFCKPGFKLHWNKKDCIRENVCPTLRGSPVVPGAIKCRSKSCYFTCNSQSTFQAFNPMNPAYRYQCGLPTSVSPRARTSRDGQGEPQVTLQLDNRDDTSTNNSLPDCTDSNARKIRKVFNLKTRSCHLMPLRIDVNSSLSSGSTFECSRFSVKCLPSKKRTRRPKSLVTVEIEFIISLRCGRKCNSKRFNNKAQKALKTIKKSFKKQLFVIELARTSAMVFKKKARETLSSLKSRSGCLLGQARTGERTCGFCGAGQFFDVVNGSCMACEAGSYQDRLGQISCTSCPLPAVGGLVSADQASQCAGICPPGRVSVDGLLPCQPCPTGTYQAESGRRSCVSCGIGITTQQTGSTSFQQCLVRGVCGAGHYYDGNNAICVRCPVGYYQSERGQTFCRACPGNTTTDYDAAQSLESCKERRCGGVIGDLHGVIESPNYPGEYPINSVCSWEIRPKKRSLLIVVPEIFLPVEDNCGDYLIMKKKASSTSRYVYQSCQTLANPIALIVRTKKLLIEFKSNGHNGARGFRIPYVTYDPNYDKIIQEIVDDSRLYSPDYYRNMLKDKTSREALFKVLAEPHMYFKYYKAQGSHQLFSSSFMEFLTRKISSVFDR